MKNNYGQEPKPVNFGDSIRICFKKYAVFDGRASRSELWYFKLFWWIIAILTLLLPWTVGNIIWIIFGLGAMIPMISVNCRRLHDINKSGWFQLIPIVNLIMWAQDPSEGSNNNKSLTSKNFSRSSSNLNKKKDLADNLEELQELYYY